MIIEDNFNQEETTVEETFESNVEQIETPQITITPVDSNFVEPEYKTEESFQENQIEAQEEQIIETPEVPVFEINDEKVIQYLKSKGLQAESLDDLKPKESVKLSAEVEKFIEFTEKTGNSNYNDFLATQKNWSEVSEQERIIEKMKIDYPNLDSEDIQLMFEDKYGYDEDLDDERTIRLRKLTQKVDAQDALKTLESRKELYKVNRGSEDLIPQDFKEAKQIVEQQKANAEVYRKQYDDFVKATESVFTKDFEGFKVKVDGQELAIKPSNVELSKKEQLDIINFQKKYFDDKGNIADPKGYHKALFAAMNPDKYAEHFYNLGKASYAEQEDKESKNISMNTTVRKPGTSLGNVVVKVVK
jgi:hypothetical protein